MDETCEGEGVEALKTECEDLRAVVFSGTTTPRNPCGKTLAYWLAEGPAANVTHPIANRLEALPRPEGRGFR